MLKNIILLVSLIISIPAYAQNSSCDISIKFGSYSAGIDGATYASIRDYLDTSPIISQKFIANLGKEGEREICVILNDKNNINIAFDEIQKLIPKTSKKGWVALSNKNGQSFKNEWPKDYMPKWAEE